MKVVMMMVGCNKMMCLYYHMMMVILIMVIEKVDYFTFLWCIKKHAVGSTCIQEHTKYMLESRYSYDSRDAE